MASPGRLAIQDEFSRQTGIFVTFLRDIQKDWPSETAVIAQQLDQYDRHISQISSQYSVYIAQRRRSFHGLEDHALPSLPSDTPMSPNFSVATDQDHLHDNIPMTTPLSSEACNGFSEDLPSQITDTSMFPTFMLDCQTNNERRPDLQIVPIPCGSAVGTAPHLATEEWLFQEPASDTIDPMTLHLHSGHSRHEQRGSISSYRFDFNLPSGSMTHIPFTESENWTALTDRSSNQAGAVKRAYPLDISSQRCTASRGKRLKSQRTPSCSAEDYSKLRNELARFLDHDDMDLMPTMCDLYYATASTDAILQLKDIISAVRHAESWKPGPEFSSVSGTVRALDKLDVMQHSVAFLRRVLLVRLADHRDNKMKGLEIQRAKTRTTQQDPVGGKLESQVLDLLLREAYPDTSRQLEECDSHELKERYKVERKALKNRLTSAKNWRCAVKLFGFGILALIPTGGSFQIQNQRFETLRQKQCDGLLKCLETKEHGYVSEAAKRLTPFVRAVYDGRDFASTLAVESLNGISAAQLDSSRLLELFSEL